MKRRDFMVSATAAALTTASRTSDATDAVPGDAAQVTWTRQVPVRYETDVLVLGGGIAGVSAAAAAARSGARVLLVERFAVTGGMLTTGGVANFCGQMERQGEVFDHILADLRQWKALGGEGRPSVFHYEILAIVLQELLLQRKVKLLLHTRFVDARITDDGRLGECIICGKSGPEAVRARQFIDCTGDGDVARAAGFETVKGGDISKYQLPMSLMYFVRHVERKDARSSFAGRLVPAGPQQGRSADDQRVARRPGRECDQDQDPHVSTRPVPRGSRLPRSALAVA